jgi:hypothetical protein
MTAPLNVELLLGLLPKVGLMGLLPERVITACTNGRSRGIGDPTREPSGHIYRTPGSMRVTGGLKPRGE